MFNDILKTLPHNMSAPDIVDEPTLESAVQYIDEMDFSNIRMKLTKYVPLVCRVWSDDDYLNLQRAFEITQFIYEEEFGEKMLNIWQ
ncbi:hypothetical protein [Dickeya poaceiphila]|uniref:Uncharacterized protein n=1 Tax=Dickeya poaceiphila TaxID=568768 RepID=A0A5B8HUE5_9GAMM|nr:hypothetical protein [Dickeya poaceiphila]QDX31806.1 hypothetical protein Dpoa569_0003880 [Dickeya poaceiphila]